MGETLSTKAAGPGTSRLRVVTLVGLVGLVCVALTGCGGSAAGGASVATQQSQGAIRAAMQRLGGVELRYRPRAGLHPVTSSSLDQATAIINRRLEALHVSKFWAGVASGSAGREVVVLVADASAGAIHSVERQAGATGQLQIYGWEPNVIGPSGQPAPGESTVTGGPSAGESQFGLPEYQAVMRAARRSAVSRSSDTTYQVGCTAQANQARTGANAGCQFGEWYLVNRKDQRVLAGPFGTEQEAYATSVPAGIPPEAVRINPGTVIVQAKAAEGARGQIINPSPPSWYVVNDEPVLTGADIRGVESKASGNGQATVTLSLIGAGQQRFQRLITDTANRSREAQLPGVSASGAAQHYAVVLDHQIIAVPAVSEPHGSSSLSIGLPPSTAGVVMAELQFGELPVELELVTVRHMPEVNPVSTATPSASLPEVGTITLTGNGTTVAEQFNLGSLGEGQAAAPPTEVLASCSSDINSSSIITTSAFAQGEVLLTYAKGSVPAEMSFHGLEPEAPGLAGITGISGHLLVNIGGAWDCNEEDHPTLTLEPGETKAVSFWIMLPSILSNEHPHLNQRELDTEALISPISVSQITTGSHETVSGPKVADCEGVRFLLPFAHLPFSVTVEAGGPMEHRLRCGEI